MKRHFNLTTRNSRSKHEPIQNALRALVYASDPDTVEAPRRPGPRKSWFIRGICYAYRDDKPFQLRKAAPFFLPLISSKWFIQTLSVTMDSPIVPLPKGSPRSTCAQTHGPMQAEQRGLGGVTQRRSSHNHPRASVSFNPSHSSSLPPRPIMEPNQTRSLCVDWASTVDGIERAYYVQKAAFTVFFGMIDSPRWRPHIVVEKWKLLWYFTLVPNDSQPLRRCINSLELMYAIRGMGNLVALVLWLEILWLKRKVRGGRRRLRGSVVVNALPTPIPLSCISYVSCMNSIKSTLEGNQTKTGRFALLR